MSEMNERKIFDLSSKDLRHATDAELEELKKLPDNDLLRASGTLDAFAITESMRRLKDALQSEERAIRYLTGILVILTIILVWLGYKALPL